MIRLYAAENRRLIRRRLTRWTLFALALGVLAIAFLAGRGLRPPTPQQEAQNQAMYQQAVADWKATGKQQIADCKEGNKSAAASGQPEVDCDNLAPRPEWYRATPAKVSNELGSLPMGVTLLGGAVMVLVSASFVGAEFVHHTMGTWLLAEPRRTRVYVTKLVTMGVAAGVLSLALTTISLVLLGLIGRIDHMDFDITAAHQATFLNRAGRAVIIVIAAAMGSAGLAFVLRHTAAVLVGVGAWGLASMYWLGNSSFGWLSLDRNLEAWINRTAIYQWTSCGPDGGCHNNERTITMSQGGAMLLGVSVVAILLGWVLFRRRDVA